MKCIRIHRKRLLLFVVISSLTFYFLYLLSENRNTKYDCTVPASIHDRMPAIIKHIENALDALHVPYFVCYETLWGALKVEGPLPWQKTIDLCILNKDVSKIDEVFLVRTFKRNQIDISYNVASGVYSASMIDHESPTASLYVFEEDSVTHQMRRVGWTNRVLPPNACDILHCFPPSLLSQPLPFVKFLSLKLPAPREEIEIQKYLYPNSWWKELSPINCK